MPRIVAVKYSDREISNGKKDMNQSIDFRVLFIIFAQTAETVIGKLYYWYKLVLNFPKKKTVL